MRRSFLFLVTASRMRSCACDTASRLCVRTELCSPAFLLVPPLPSIGSAAARAALFADFLGIIGESDCSVPFIFGYDLRSSRCGPANRPRRAVTELSRFPCRRRMCMPGSQTTRGGTDPRAIASAPVAFCCHDGIGTPDYIALAAHNLAYTHPCQRFA